MTLRRACFLILSCLCALPLSAASAPAYSSLATGSNFSVVLKSDGSVWTWGGNEHGQLGDGSFSLRSTPAKILADATQIAAGSHFALALKKDGTVWAWGQGPVGNGTWADQASPVKVADKAQAVFAGSGQGFYVDKKGVAYSWGINWNGQLGQDVTGDQNAPGKALEGVKSITAGENFSLFLKTDGTLWGAGYDKLYMQSGYTGKGFWKPQKVADDIKAICSGPMVLAIKKDDTFWCWGRSFSGGERQVAPQKMLDKVLALVPGIWNFAAIDAGGRVLSFEWSWADQKWNQPSVVTDHASAASLGEGFGLAIKSDGTLWSWGGNAVGQLGLGWEGSFFSPRKIETSVPVVEATMAGVPAWLGKTGEVFTSGGKLPQFSNIVHITSGQNDPLLAIDAGGTLWRWDGRASSSPTKMLDSAVEVSANLQNALALDASGKVWSWGLNYSGQLGDGTYEHSDAPKAILSNMRSVNAGGWHGLAVNTDGALWAWGSDGSRQLGDADMQTKPTPFATMQDVEAAWGGRDFSFALKKDGTVWTWGANLVGQLGTGDYGGGNKPVKIDVSDVVTISAGSDFTLFLKKDGSLWGTGSNQFGQLGTGKDERNTLSPKKIMDDVAFIEASVHRSVVVKRDGSLWAFGENLELVLGSQSEVTQPRQIAKF